MPTLRFVVHRNDLLAVVPPVFSGVIICRLDLQNGIAAVRKLHKVVQIRQHPRIQRVLEHDLPLKDMQPGFLRKNPRNQILQQMSHFQCDPVLIHVCLYDAQLVVVKISRCPPGRNAEDRSSVAAADAPPSIGQPFFATQITCIYQLLRLILQPQHHSFLPSSTPAAVPHASAREPLCDDTPQTAAAVLRDAISFVISFGYRLSQKKYPQSLSAFGQKKNENAQRRSFFCVAVIPAICGRCAPKKKSGRNLSCGHGNSTGNRKSLTMRVQVGILRTLLLSCRKQYAQISITSQLYHKILWLSRKG